MKRFHLSFKLLTIILMIMPLIAFESRSVAGGKPLDPTLNPDPIYWYEKGIKKQAWMALDEIAGLPVKGAAAPMNAAEVLQHVHPRAQITEKSDFVVYYDF